MEVGLQVDAETSEAQQQGMAGGVGGISVTQHPATGRKREQAGGRNDACELDGSAPPGGSACLAFRSLRRNQAAGCGDAARLAFGGDAEPGAHRPGAAAFNRARRTQPSANSHQSQNKPR